jgi:hypothetical protein
VPRATSAFGRPGNRLPARYASSITVGMPIEKGPDGNPNIRSGYPVLPPTKKAHRRVARYAPKGKRSDKTRLKALMARHEYNYGCTLRELHGVFQVAMGRMSPQTPRRQVAPVTFLSGTRVTSLSVTYSRCPSIGRYGKSGIICVRPLCLFVLGVRGSRQSVREAGRQLRPAGRVVSVGASVLSSVKVSAGHCDELVKVCHFFAVAKADAGADAPGEVGGMLAFVHRPVVHTIPIRRVTENEQACLALLVMRSALLRLRRRWRWRWPRRPRDNPLEADGAAIG